LVYPFTVLKNPAVENENKKSFFKFIWNGKPDKIKRNVLVNEYKDGGMKLTNVNMFLNSSKCGWVKRMLNTESNGCWKIVYNHILNRNAGKIVF